MKKEVRYAPGDEANFERPRLSESDAERLGVSDLIAHFATRYIFNEPGELELYEGRQDPNTDHPAHAHVEDEIIYVLEGSLTFRGREFGPGSAIFVPAWTLYSFKSGPGGVRFTNFRPRAAARRYITEQEWMDEQEKEVQPA